MQKVAIVDYGMGNLDSVARAVEEAGAEAIVTDKAEDFRQAARIILPGVGSFAEGARNIFKLGLDKLLAEQVLDNNIPFLGICLGMQLLAETGFEGGKAKGLGWIPGEVVKLVAGADRERIPHVGWNCVDTCRQSLLFEGIPQSSDFYFVHSYHLAAKEEADVLARTNYCGRFVCAVQKNNIFGVQFHPEKSLDYGLKLIRNFLSIPS